MKYYAVTDNPNELLHYGRLGMKWGKHIFGDKPKSSGYKRALGKLRASANKTKAVIKKNSEQHAINKQKKQQERYAKAVEKTQRRINAIEGLNSLNRLKDIERSADKAYKNEQRFIRSEARMQKYNARSERKAEKQALKYARNEKHMDKYLQQARHGKLKYGKLSDEQVREITDRLNMERSARMLGSAEKTWRQQKRDALRAGKLKGIEAGTAAAMTEVARAGAQYGIQHLMNRKKLDAMSRYNAKRQKEADRIKNHRTHKEVKEDLRDDLYEEAIKEGKGVFGRRVLRVKGAAKKLNTIETQRLEEDRKRKLQARIDDEMDMGNNETYQKFLTEQREKKRVQDVQDRLANEKEEAWQRYLSDNNMTDEEARAREFLPKGKPITYKFNGKTITIMDGGQASEEERKKLNEGKIKGAGSVEEQRQRILNKEKEARKEKEQKALEIYEDIQRYDEKKERVDKHNERVMNVYQQKLAAFNRGERTSRPAMPTVKNGQLWEDPKMPKVHVDQYKIMQDLRLSPYNASNGGGNKKGNKKGNK